jgi:tetratricopeptide (TPR) repeat protein
VNETGDGERRVGRGTPAARMGAVAWPLALLLVFGVAFQGAVRTAFTGRGLSHAGASLECETPPKDDITVLERCLTLEPTDIELMLDLGSDYEAAGRWDDAERVYRRAVDVDRLDGELHLRLARLLLRRGDLAAARAEGDRALTTLPGNAGAREIIERATTKAARP